MSATLGAVFGPVAVFPGAAAALSFGTVTAGQLLSFQLAYWNPVGDDPVDASNVTQTAGTATIGTVAVDRQDAIQADTSVWLRTAVFSVRVATSGTLTLSVAGLQTGSAPTVFGISLNSDVGWSNNPARRLDGAGAGQATALNNLTSWSTGEAEASGTAALNSVMVAVLTWNAGVNSLLAIRDGRFSSIGIYNDGTTAEPAAASYLITSAPTKAFAAWSGVMANAATEGASATLVAYREGVTPLITAQPQTQTTTTTATYSITEVGATSYQWQRQAPGGGSWSNVVGGTGATTATYTTPTVTRADTGALYRCVATNADGSSTSDAGLLVVPESPASETGAVGLVVGSSQSWVGFGWVGAAEAAGAPEGTLSVTLGAATLSAAGTLPLVGTASATLAAATLSSTGTLPIVGTSTVTLGAATVAAAGALTNTGALTATLAAVTLASTGTLPLQGALSVTLGAATVAFTGTLPLAGTLTATLAAATLSSAGGVALSGALSATLAAATLSATGSSGATGALTATLADATLSSAGAAALAGTTSATLAAATLSSAGGVALAGTLSQTLEAATLSAAGSSGANGAVTATLADAALSSTGTLALVGTSTSTLAAATLAAAGVLPLAGSLSATLGAATLTAAGEGTQNDGTLTATLADASLSATGRAAVAGAVSATLEGATLSATGRADIAGTLGVTLGDLVLSAFGAPPRVGTLTATLGALALAATGIAGTIPVNSAPPLARRTQGTERELVAQAAQRGTRLQTARRTVTQRTRR